MPNVCIRSYIWIRPASTGVSELVPMRHHESGPGVKYPDGGGFASKQDMIDKLTRRSIDLYPFARIKAIENGIEIDYMKQYPAVDLQQITWEE